MQAGKPGQALPTDLAWVSGEISTGCSFGFDLVMRYWLPSMILDDAHTDALAMASRARLAPDPHMQAELRIRQPCWLGWRRQGAQDISLEVGSVGKLASG